MSDTTISCLEITGRFDAGDFWDFAGLYASRLDLNGEFRSDANGIRISVQGHPELIDMFEVAMWLGPRHALVDHIDNAPTPGDNRLFGGFRWV